MQHNTINKLKRYFDKTPVFIHPKSSLFLKQLPPPQLYNNHLKTTTTAYLKTDEKGLKTITKRKYKLIFFCVYRIVGSGHKEKFLQYLLYKYPKEEKDICIFPFVKYKAQTGVEKQLKDFMAKELQISKIMGWNMKGFIESEDNIFLFIKLQSELGKFSNQKNKKKRKDKLWWALIDEICNQRKILNFPIHKIVTNIFLHNPLIIYLRNTEGGNKPIPRVLFYGNASQIIPFNFVFGPKPEDIKTNYGPYFYLGSYKKAIRYGGWSVNYKKEKRMGQLITDDNGKWDKGGIARYAVYLGSNLKVLLNHPLDKVIYTQEDKMSDPMGIWTQTYTSLYYGQIKIPELKGGVWRDFPGWVIKNFNQQIPLTFHFINKKTLKPNWDSNYDNYYIE